jgi:hypothetical protein
VHSRLLPLSPVHRRFTVTLARVLFSFSDPLTPEQPALPAGTAKFGTSVIQKLDYSVAQVVHLPSRECAAADRPQANVLSRIADRLASATVTISSSS